MVGQVCQSLIFLNVSNIDRCLRNPEEHTNSITAPYRLLPVTESFALPPVLREAAYWDPNRSVPTFRQSQSNVRGPMMLSRIVPGCLNFDSRTFECVRCDHVEKV
jgi:hypothetical protein